MRILLTASVVLCLLASCSQEDGGDSTTENPKVDTTDTLGQSDTAANIVVDTVLGVEFNMSEYSDEKSEMAELNREKPQDPFCDCVLKMDSLNTLMMADDTPDDVFNAAMKENNRLVNNECANVLAGPSLSEEDKAEHERKVKKCLRNR